MKNEIVQYVLVSNAPHKRNAAFAANIAEIKEDRLATGSESPEGDAAAAVGAVAMLSRLLQSLSCKRVKHVVLVCLVRLFLLQ